MATAVANAEPASHRWRLPERLPEIHGPALLAYRLIWFLVAVLAVMSVGYFNYRWTNDQITGSATVYATGLAPIDRFADGQHVRPLSPESRRAGVIDNDVIISIDGHPAPDNDKDLGTLLDGRDGSRIIVGLRDPSGRSRDVTLTRSSDNWRDAYAGSGLTPVRAFWIYFAIDACANLLYLCAASVLFIRKPADPVAALLSLGMLLYLVNSRMIVPSLTFVWTATGSLSGAMLWLGLLFFPDGRLAPRWWPFAVVAILSAAVLNTATFWIPAALTVLQFVGFLALALTVAAVVGRFRAGSRVVRQQMKFAMLGFVACFGLVILSIILTQAAPFASTEGVRAWLGLLSGLTGSLAAVAIATGLLIALLRYRLYDVDSAIGRSAAYGAMTIGFVVLFASSEKLIELLGQQYFGQSVGGVAGGVAAALAAVVIAPMHTRSHRWAQKRFQKALFRLRHGLPPLVGDLRETAGLEQIAGATLDAIVAGVRARHAALISGETVIDAREISAAHVEEWRRNWTPASHEGIDRNRSDPVFPIRVPLEAEGHGRVGWLLLGSRPDGSLFGKSECDAIENIAEPVARAVQVALRRQERERQIESRLQRVETEVRRTSAKLGQLLKPRRPHRASIGPGPD